MTDFSKSIEEAAAAANATNIVIPTFKVTFEAPGGVKTTIEVGSDQRQQWPSVLPGPAAVDPGSPEGQVLHLFGKDYGDGSLILLDKEDSQFKEKQQALRDSGRRFDPNAGGWVRKG